MANSVPMCRKAFFLLARRAPEKHYWRVLSQVRTAPIGRFFVSFEPYIVVGTDLTIVPIRFALGGMFGTKQRPTRPRSR